jgi:surfactin synthase thioesterase subunit
VAIKDPLVKRSINFKLYERESSSIEMLFLHLPGRAQEYDKNTPVRISGVAAQIRTQQFQKTILW